MSFRNFTTTAAAAALSLTLGSCVERGKEEGISPVVSGSTEYYSQLVGAIERGGCNYEKGNLVDVYNSCNSVVKLILDKKGFHEIEPFLSGYQNLKDRYIADVRKLDGEILEILAMLADNDDLDSRNLIESSALYKDVFVDYNDSNVGLLKNYVKSITLFVRLWLVALNDEEREELYKDPRIKGIIEGTSNDVEYGLNLIEIYKKRRNA